MKLRTYTLQTLTTLVLLLAVPVVASACGTIDLTVSKSGPATVVQGGILTYQLTVRQSNPSGAATHTVLTDNLPAGLIFIPQQHVGLSFNANTGVWTVGSDLCRQTGNQVICDYFPGLHSIASAVVQLDFRVTAACGTVLHNTASVTATEMDTNPHNNTSNTVTTTVLCQPTPTPVIPTPTPAVPTPTPIIPTPTPRITPTPTPTPHITPTPTPRITPTPTPRVTPTPTPRPLVTPTPTVTPTPQPTPIITIINNIENINKNSNDSDVTVKTGDVNVKTWDQITKVTTPTVAGVTTVTPVPVPVTAKTGAGAIGLLSTLLGSTGLVVTKRKLF